MTLFKSLFESKNKTFIFHNAKFDLRFFLHQRIVIRNVYDTFLGEKLLWLGFPSGFHGLSLEAICKDYLNIQLDKSVRGRIHRGLTDEVIVYGCNDVKYLIPLKDAQEVRLKENGLSTAIFMENSFVPVLAYTEYSGLKLNVTAWKAKMKSDEERLRSASEKLNGWVVQNVVNSKFVDSHSQGDLFTGFDAGPQCTINWSSSKQVVPFLKSLGFNLRVKDPNTGAWKDSVEAEVIKPQISKSPVAALYIEFKECEKVTTTYGQNFLDQLNPVTKRLHTQFNQLMDTTRLSSGGEDKDTGQKNINFQNIPSDNITRSCFVAEEGNLLIDCDYSAQEDFIFTQLSMEPKLIEFYNDTTKKRDGHSFVAKLCFKKQLDEVPEEEVKRKFPELRSKAKSAKFAIHYGGNGGTIARNLSIPTEEGDEIYNSYLGSFTGIKSYFRKVISETWSQGYALISRVTGHKAYIYDWKELKQFEALCCSEFWSQYRIQKARFSREERENFWKGIPTKAQKAAIRWLFTKFSNGDSPESISKEEYLYIERDKKNDKVKKVIRFFIPEPLVWIEAVTHFFKRRGSSEKMALNYPIQGTSAQVTKLAAIMYYRHLIKQGLLFIVLMPNQVHDEILVEAPESLVDQEKQALQTCMETAGKRFCQIVLLKAVPETGKCWKH